MARLRTRDWRHWRDLCERARSSTVHQSLENPLGLSSSAIRRDERTNQMIERAVRWSDWAEGHTEHTGTGPCACAFEEKSKTTDATLTLK